jgi:hypothetical protein
MQDLGLAQIHRAVKYEGTLTQVYPMSTAPVYTVLLDNYRRPFSSPICMR